MPGTHHHKPIGYHWRVDRVLVALDKFKDALSAERACEVAATVVARKFPHAVVQRCPLTDGGDGFCPTIVEAVRRRYPGQFGIAHVTTHAVAGPLGQPRDAPLGFVAAEALPGSVRSLIGAQSGLIAVVEMATASGLQWLPFEQRDPWSTTSFGTGELLRLAAAGANAVLLGVGGSATHDLGLGALQALGLVCLNDAGQIVSRAEPRRWHEITGFDSRRLAALPPLVIARDVDNPLLGERGASRTFAPQKGLRRADVPRLERATERMSTMLLEHFGVSSEWTREAGAGAAGGLPFGLGVAYGARGVSGSQLVAALFGLEDEIAAADLVVTGEGRFDASSIDGKAPGYVLKRATALGKRAVVLAGSVAALPAVEPGRRLTVLAITPPGMELSVALAQTEERLAATLEAWLDSSAVQSQSL